VFRSKLATLERILRLITFLLGDTSILEPQSVAQFSRLHKVLELTVSTDFVDSGGRVVVSLYEAAFGSKSGESSVETCEICDAPIRFEQITSAHCLNGHEFRMLTFTSTNHYRSPDIKQDVRSRYWQSKLQEYQSIAESVANSF
jgi:transcription factor IIIC subunit-like protein